jgi:hypothetical protein
LPSLERLVVDNSSMPTVPPDVEDLREIKRIEISLMLIGPYSQFFKLQKFGMLKKLENYIIELRSGGNLGAVTNQLASASSGGLRHLKKLGVDMCGCFPLKQS